MMYCTRIEIKPTGGMTFRVMPGANLDITSYRFLPPTTMSGFLRRVSMMAAGHELPQTTISSKKSPAPYFALPPHLIATGALPHGTQGLHKTHRKGPSNFKHYGFSSIFRDKMEKNEMIQLHTWEYFFCDSLVGYVLSHDEEALLPLQDCVNWGCKIGKEGYAVVAQVSAPYPLTVTHKKAIPSTLLAPDQLTISDLYQPMEIVSLYRYQWADQAVPFALTDDTTASIEGYVPIPAAIPAPSAAFTLDYLHDQHGDTHIPTSWLQLISGTTQGEA